MNKLNRLCLEEQMKTAIKLNGLETKCSENAESIKKNNAGMITKLAVLPKIAMSLISKSRLLKKDCLNKRKHATKP